MTGKGMKNLYGSSREKHGIGQLFREGKMIYRKKLHTMNYEYNPHWSSDGPHQHYSS